MRIRAGLAGIWLVAGAALLPAAVLDHRTLQGWNQYITEARTRAIERAQSPNRFLWTDESPQRRAQVSRGAIVVAPAGSSHARHVPLGMIHDWIGAVFIPNATLEETLSVVRNYPAYKDFYRPLIVDAAPLSSDGADSRFSLVVVNKTLFSSTALHCEFRDSYFQVDRNRSYSFSTSYSVREIENYGQANQRELPPDQGDGYIWRLFSISRFEERDNGVYVEREVIALSRDIPATLRFLIDPIVNHLSRESLSTALSQTRQAVRSSLEAKSLKPRSR